MSYILAYVWHDLYAWAGVCLLVMVGSGYLIVTTPFPLLRHAAVSAFTIAACILYLYPKAFLDGANHVKAEVAKQELALRAAGDHARADALAAANSGVRDPFDDDWDK